MTILSETHIEAKLVHAVKEYVDAALATGTRRLYRSLWNNFVGWCDEHGAVAMPATPQVVALYICARAEAGLSVSSLQNGLAAIRLAHEAAGVDQSPTGSMLVRKVMAGIRRTIGVRAVGKAPLMTRDLRQMVQSLDLGTNRGLRDAAALVVGFAGAFRRSELVGLDVQHVTFTEDGIRVLIARSKTDQEGQGRVIGLPWGSHPETCPVRVLRRWLDHAEITEGPLFPTVDRAGRIQRGSRMSGRGVARCVKRSAEAAGLDPTKVSGHSLRSGFCTSAATAGASERSIMNQTGHRSVMVLRRYIRDGSLFSDNAAAVVGL